MIKTFPFQQFQDVINKCVFFFLSHFSDFPPSLHVTIPVMNTHGPPPPQIPPQTTDTIKANGLLLPQHVDDYPVLLHVNSLPPHGAVLFDKPEVTVACHFCIQAPSRFRSALLDFQLSSVSSLPAVQGCSCRNQPDNNNNLGRIHRLLDSPATFSFTQLPPAMPPVHSRNMLSLEGKPLVPGELPYVMVPSEELLEEWPPGPHAPQHSTTISLRLLLLSEPVILADDFYSFYFTMKALRHTEGEMNACLDNISTHTSRTCPVPGVAEPIRQHCANLIRCLRDYIIPMDKVHEVLRAHAPPTWWNCKLFSCKSTAPFGWGIHTALASCHLHLLDVQYLLSYVGRFPIAPTEETALLCYLHYARPNPRASQHSPHTRFLHSLCTHLLELTNTLTAIAAYGSRRFYLSSHLMFSYRFARNNGIFEQYSIFYQDLAPLGTLKQLCTKPAELALRRHYFISQPCPDLDKRYKDLFLDRQTWYYPKVPRIVYSTSISRFFPAMVFSLDSWRRVESKSCSDTCCVYCSASCVCMRSTVEDQVARKKVSSHLPSEWPNMELDRAMLVEIPNVESGSWSPVRTSTPDPSRQPPASSPRPETSPPPSPIPNTTQDVGPHSLPSSPARVRRTRPALPRRPFTDVTNFLFFLVMIFLPLALGQTAAVQKGNFLFSTVTEKVLLNPAHVVFARKLDFEGLTDSLDKLRGILSTYEQICVQTLKSPGMEPTYVHLSSPLLSYDINTACRQHKLLPPTVESSRERKSLETMLVNKGIQQLASPYVAAGPGPLHSRVFLKSTDGYIPVIPVLAIDETTSKLNATFPALYRLGPMNRLRLSFLSGALNLTSMTSPSAFPPKHLICRNPSAYHVRPGNTTAFPIIKRLCGSEMKLLSDNIKKLQNIIDVIQPKFIDDLSFDDTKLKRPFFLNNTQSQTFAGRPHQELLTRANYSFASLAQHLFRQKAMQYRPRRSAGAALLGGAVVAVLLANAIANAYSIANLAEVNARVDTLADQMNAIQLMTTEMKTAIARVATYQSEFAESLNMLNNELTASVLLLQITGDFHMVMGNVQFAMGTLLDIVTSARQGFAHEYVVDANFLVQAQNSEQGQLALDPGHVRASLVRNRKQLYILLQFPVEDPKRSGTLLRIDPFPIFREGKSFLPRSVPSHVIVMSHEDRYVPLEPSEVTNCVDNPLDCRTTSPLLPPTLSACGPPDYFHHSSTCSYTLEATHGDFYRTFGNTTFFRVEQERVLHRHCMGAENTRSTFRLVGSGKFVLPSHCQATDMNNLRLIGTDVSSPKILIADILSPGISPTSNMDVRQLHLPKVNTSKYDRLLQDISSISIPSLIFPSYPSLLQLSLAGLVILILTLIVLYNIIMYRVRRLVSQRLESFTRHWERLERDSIARPTLVSFPPSIPPPPPFLPPSPPTSPPLGPRYHLRANPLDTVHSPPRRRHRSTTTLTAVDSPTVPSRGLMESPLL